MATAWAATAPGRDWQPIAVPPLDRSAEHRFEVVRTIADFGDDVGDWRAFRGGQQAAATAAQDTRTGRGPALRIVLARNEP